jgi:H/ACA ribonucleoprotein complex subunit 4
MDTNLLIKTESPTDSQYGQIPEKRSIEDHIQNGIILLDKPKGPTCNEIDIILKKMFNLNKVGHGGTLDPNVTGVLPILLSNSTKILKALQGLDKEYVCILELHSKINPDLIKKTIKTFIGTNTQMPPKRSAVKRQLREREIYNIEILEIKDRHVLFKTKVQAGTYIRTLCVDIGKKLGTKAHMHSLRRIKSGPFDESNLSTLHDIKDAIEQYKEKNNETELKKHIYPIEIGTNHLKKIIIKDTAISSIINGSPLHIQGISKYSKKIKKNEQIVIYSLKNELIALATAKLKTDKIRTQNKGICATINRVIMPKNIYPNSWQENKQKH